MNRKVITIAGAAIAIILAIVCFILLPAEVISKVDFSGNPTTTMPRLVAVVVPLAISIAGALYVSSTEKANKGIALIIIGYAVDIAMLIMNR